MKPAYTFRLYLLTVAAALFSLIPQKMNAGHYENFKVSSYIMVQDVARIAADKELREKQWKTISDQLDLDKIYIETYRDGFTIDEKALKEVITFFRKQGLEIGGGVTLTSQRPGTYPTFSYAVPEDREKVKEIIGLTARYFDEIILDDFFFIDIKNDEEIAAKGDRSWTEYRLDLMDKAGKELVADHAHKINPDCKVIIKYPNWYDHFQGLGFNLETQPSYFDAIWTGNETRDPATEQHLQNYLSYNISTYFSNIAPGKNLGGWVDLGGINLGIDRYAEQLHLSMIAKLPEMILWHYSALATPVNPNTRKEWQGTGNSFDYDAIMEPFQKNGKEITPTTTARIAHVTLHDTDKIVGKLGKPVGLVSYKPYHSAGESFLQNYLGMIGLPMDILPVFPEDRRQVLLTQQAADDPQIVEKIKQQLKRGGDVIITSGLLKKKMNELAEICELYCDDLKAIVQDFGRHGKSEREFIIPQVKYYTNDAWEMISAGRPLTGGVSGFPIMLRNLYSNGTLYVLTIPDDFGNLYDYPEGALNVIRATASKDVGYYIEGPAKVALFPYDNNTFIVENFNDDAVEINIAMNDKIAEIVNISTGEKISPSPVPESRGWRRQESAATKFKVSLPAHSYATFTFEK